MIFTPVPKERQRAAVKFLKGAVFATPEWAVRSVEVRPHLLFKLSLHLLALKKEA